MKDLLRTQDLSRDDVEMLLSTAAEFAAGYSGIASAAPIPGLHARQAGAMPEGFQ